jgi:hypothetical protein
MHCRPAVDTDGHELAVPASANWSLLRSAAPDAVLVDVQSNE